MCRCSGPACCCFAASTIIQDVTSDLKIWLNPRIVSAAEPLTAFVLIVGAGPTGLTLANILGQANVPALVIDRETGTVTEPRAVSIDDEALRTLQAIGLHDEVLKDVVAGYGIHYYTKPGGRCFARVEPTVAEYGFPRRNAFRQPLLEATLLRGAQRFSSVRVLFGHTLQNVTQDAGGIVASVARVGGEIIQIRARYLAACDGGSSPVRKLCGVAMAGSSFESRWLVLDTENDADPFRQTRVYCDPRRPVVDLPGPHRTRRFELLLKPHERDEDMLQPQRIRELLRPFRGDADAHIVRKTVYTFHARIAERWRIGNIFLAGDAAHLTPPYAGQGMNSGIRDSHNLGWKLAAAAAGTLGDRALDSYEIERRDHAWSLIRLALNLGVVMAPGNRAHAFAVISLLTAASCAPPLRDYLLQMKFKPPPRFKTGLVVADGRPAKSTVVGRMLPQPVVDTDGQHRLLDDILGHGYALISYGAIDDSVLAGLSHPLWERLVAVRVSIAAAGGNARQRVQEHANVRLAADRSGALAPMLKNHAGKMILVRPDRYIAGVFAPEDEFGFAEIFGKLLG